MIVNVQKRRRRRKLNAWRRQRVIVNAEKEAEKAQRVAKAVERDAKWTADADATIVRMVGGGSTYSKTASELGNGLTISKTGGIDIRRNRPASSSQLCLEGFQVELLGQWIMMQRL